MKLKSKILSLILVAVLTFSLPTLAFASTHTNTSNDTERFVVYAASGTVLVPFALAITMKMDIVVSHPGKYITYESMYTTVPGGAQLPFNASVNAGNIKYYKDGEYRTTHSLPLSPSYYKNPSDLTDLNAGEPNSNLADSSTYKAVGYATYISSSTTPAAYTGDTTEGVVD